MYKRHHTARVMQYVEAYSSVVSSINLTETNSQLLTDTEKQYLNKLESAGYSILPSPSRLMQRTHTKRDIWMPTDIIPPLAKQWRR